MPAYYLPRAAIEYSSQGKRGLGKPGSRGRIITALCFGIGSMVTKPCEEKGEEEKI
jgi:hypothetical protein